MSKNPDRPSSVPPGATYDHGSHRWTAGRFNSQEQRAGLWRTWTKHGALSQEVEFHEDQPHGAYRVFNETSGKLEEEGAFKHGEKSGIWRKWRADGSLAEEATFRGDELDGVARRFDAGGKVTEEVAYAAGVREGPARLLVSPGQFRRSEAAYECGTHLGGQPIGVWFQYDAAGHQVGRIDHGLPRPEDTDFRTLPAFSEVGRPANLWTVLAEVAEEQRRPGEVLIAAARGAAESGVVAALVDALTRLTVARSDETARKLAEEASSGADGDVLQLCGALVRGADPVQILSEIGRALGEAGRPHAALDCAKACMLLAPLRLDLCEPRALAHLGLGLSDEALADAGRLATLAPDRAEALTLRVAMLFPTFDFWPESEVPECAAEDLPAEPVRGLPEVKDQIQRYATRLGQVRQRLLDVTRETPAWLPPDLTGLLPQGPVALRGDEAADETLPAQADLETLLRWARSDWQALCWLCWSAGLTEVKLPAEVRAPMTFGVAAGMACQRAWWLVDRGLTGGARALKHSVAGFTPLHAQGKEAASLPPEVRSFLTNEAVDLQALFLWLIHAELRSPWQAELKDPGTAARWTFGVPKAEPKEVPVGRCHFEVFVQPDAAPFAPDSDLTEAAEGLASWAPFSRTIEPGRFAPPAFAAPEDQDDTFRFPTPGAGPAVAQVIGKATCGYAVTTAVENPEDYDYLGVALRLCVAIAEHGSGVVVDRTSGIGYSLEEFIRVADNLTVRDTVAIVCDWSQPTSRCETRGMAKFGNRDFVLNDWPTTGIHPEMARRWLYDNLCQVAAFRQPILPGETLGYLSRDPSAKVIFTAGPQGILLVSDCHEERKEAVPGLSRMLRILTPMFEDHLSQEKAREAA